MSELFFTLQNEWVRFNNGRAFVGLTGKGIDGDVVYVELPEIGQSVCKGQPCAKVESVKSVMDVHAPATGTVSAVNDAVYDDPDIVVKSPQMAWLFKVDFEGEENRDGLLTEKEYNSLI